MENLPKSPESGEKITREEVINAYKKFVDRGVRNIDDLGTGKPDSLSPTDPEVEAANELFYKWVAQIDKEAEGNEELKHRANLSKNMFYVDAGFTDPVYLEDVLQWIANDLKPNTTRGYVYKGIEKQENNPERVETLKMYADAQKKIEDMFGRREEQEGNQEKIEKARVIEMLKTNGFDNPETKEMVMKWTEQREAEIEKEGTARARFFFNIERIDLFEQISIENAWEAIKEVKVELDMDQSLSKEENDELYGMLFKKMDEVNYPKDDSAVGTDPMIDKYTK